MAAEAPEVTFSQVDELARWLFQLRDGGDWPSIDECERTHWRKEAARRLQDAALYRSP